MQPGKLVNVTFTTLKLRQTPRHPEHMLLDQMRASMLEHGYRTQHPLVVSLRSDGPYILCGVRRYLALQGMSEADRTSVLTAGKVPCLVFEGLTAAEEQMLALTYD